MIGHLQTNKVGQVIDKAGLIHSCDSVHLAEKIEKEAAKRDMIANVRRFSISFLISPNVISS